MNRAATASRTNSRRSIAVKPPIFLAKLDLQDEAQLALHSLIQRMHGGQRPLLKCLGMRQIDGVIYEAVQWPRMAPPSFGVVRWEPDGLGLSWTSAQTISQALAAMKTTNGWPSPSPVQSH